MEIEYASELVSLNQHEDHVVATVKKSEGGVELVHSEFVVGADGARGADRVPTSEFCILTDSGSKVWYENCWICNSWAKRGTLHFLLLVTSRFPGWTKKYELFSIAPSVLLKLKKFPSFSTGISSEVLPMTCTSGIRLFCLHLFQYSIFARVMLVPTQPSKTEDVYWFSASGPNFDVEKAVSDHEYLSQYMYGISKHPDLKIMDVKELKSYRFIFLHRDCLLIHIPCMIR